MFNIHELSRQFGLFAHGFKIMEIGVGPVVKTRLMPFVNEGYECHMVEGLPKYQNELQRAFGHMDNVHLYPVAISDEAGTVEIFDRGEGSWITKLPSSPDTENNNVIINERFCSPVPSTTLDTIDTGDFDVILIDTEGAEWYALQHMISRPRILVLETHLLFHSYVNPYMADIEAWTDANGYTKLATEDADTMWVI